MGNGENRSSMVRSILVMVATLATITFNFLASGGYVNGVTPQEISDKYLTVLTPAGYAFAIWSLIYAFLIAFSVYQLLPSNRNRFNSVRSIYLVSCVLNCGWIFFWHHNRIAFSFFIIVSLLISLLYILKMFRNSSETRGAIFTKGTFGIYGGWVTAASLVNFVIMLRYFNVEFSPTGWNILGAFLLMIAACIGVVVRFRLKNYLFPLAIAWAATAIAVKQSGNTAIVVAAAICVIVTLVMAVSFVMDMKSSTNE